MGLKEDIEEWVDNFVNVYNPELDSKPCPYAKKALIDNKVKITDQLDGTLRETITKHVDEWDNLDVSVIGIPKDEITPVDLVEITMKMNVKLMTKDFVILVDHPDRIETVNEVSMGNGEWALVFIQRLSNINRASKELMKTGYYDSWSDEEYELVVGWRFLDE